MTTISPLPIAEASSLVEDGAAKAPSTGAMQMIKPSTFTDELEIIFFIANPFTKFIDFYW
ncbi:MULTISPECIES: hypothetical protein [unclassified Sphingomonas]|uniref:hypothetical protein n=1 Tax=unclassified Sphingomonas TaxID=196159 RepID=UPI001F1A02B1|nr:MULTISPECIES: hypothetical protein [unclassified Sphingomonas]